MSKIQQAGRLRPDRDGHRGHAVRPGRGGEPAPAADHRQFVVLPEEALPADLVARLRGHQAVILLAPAADVPRQGSPRPAAAQEADAGPPVVSAGEPDPAEAEDVIRCHGLVIDLGERRVRAGRDPIEVSDRELELLAVLARPAGRARSFKELFTLVWGANYRVDPPVVHSAVRRLRRKLADAGVGAQIESVRGYGFRLAGLEAADGATPGTGEPASVSTEPHAEQAAASSGDRARSAARNQ